MWQLNLFGVMSCDCGQTATITQQTLFNGEEHYCKPCYDKMIEEKEKKGRELNENRHLV